MSLVLRASHDISYSNLYHSSRKVHQEPIPPQYLAESGLRNLAIETSYPSSPMPSLHSSSISARSTTEVESINPSLRPSAIPFSHETTSTPSTTPAISSSLTGSPYQSSTQPWHYQPSAADQPLTSPAPRVASSAPEVATMEIISRATRTVESETAQAILAQGPLEGRPVGRGHDAERNRQTRRTKAHVASACMNCKRAHLSCDVQRPCTRCVATGKQVRLLQKFPTWAWAQKPP